MEKKKSYFVGILKATVLKKERGGIRILIRICIKTPRIRNTDEKLGRTGILSYRRVGSSRTVEGCPLARTSGAVPVRPAAHTCHIIRG
jgi:hypothetical protein